MDKTPLANQWDGTTSEHDPKPAHTSSWSEALEARAQLVLRGGTRTLVKGTVDTALMAGAAGWAWFLAASQGARVASPVSFISGVLLVRLVVYLVTGVYRMPWRKVSSPDVRWLVGSALLGLLPLLIWAAVSPAGLGLGSLNHPYLVVLTESALHLLLLGGVRLAARAAASSYRTRTFARRVVIVGTGDAARSLVWQCQNSITDFRVVGLVDDDAQRHGTRVLGVPVLGAVADLVELVPRLQADQIVIAIPSLAPERLREMLVTCESLGVPIRILPPLRELMGNGVGIGALREVRMEDLLPRPEIKLDEDAIRRYLQGKTVLVTGGGGSIGSELCRQVLGVGAGRLLVLGRGENSVFEISQELSQRREQLGLACEVVPVVCDVQDRRSLERVFETHRPDVVFHAAAHKHVPLMEQYPTEAIKNNVLGTLNVTGLSADYLVSRFVLVSTDKAVDPTSVMGSTKRVAEKIVKGFATARDANMVSVRFGNVLGSRGSVIPVMTRQIRNGQPVTVTDPEMVRYFMTIPEATQLILQAGAIGGRGEVFVLDMGHPVRIIDLAHDLIRLCGLVPNHDVPIRIIGRRPGEKLKENILNQMETQGATKNGHFYIAPAEPVNLDNLLGQVKQLRVAAETDRNERVVALLHEIIPAYLPDPRHGLGVSAERAARTAVMGRAS
jgi:FlaA1/EpsC-like NDP-sugar epimerase